MPLAYEPRDETIGLFGTPEEMVGKHLQRAVRVMVGTMATARRRRSIPTIRATRLGIAWTEANRITR
jgi:hypothetical protein